MTSIKLFIKETQQIGPIHVWPLKVTAVSSHLYSVPPFGDKLIFSEYDDGDGGRVNVIEVHNPTDEDFMIPSGWIVGANLLQVRTFNHSELVKAGESILADVSCVEKGRWGDGQNETDGGRAPFSVIGAGWDYDAAANSSRRCCNTHDGNKSIPRTNFGLRRTNEYISRDRRTDGTFQ